MTFVNTPVRLESSSLRSKTANLLFPVTISLGTIVLSATLYFVFQSFLLAFVVGLSTCLCLLPFLLYKREPSPIAPVYLTMLYLIIAYPIKLIAFRLEIANVIEDYPGSLLDNNLVTQAMGLVGLGVLAYFVGYYGPPRLLLTWASKVRLPLSSRLDRSWPWRVLAICAIGWGVFGFQVITKTWSSFAGLGESWDPRTNQLLAYLWNYVWFSLIGAALWLLVKKYRYFTTGIGLCLGVIGISVGGAIFLLGSKTWLLYPFVWVFALAYMSGRRPSPFLVTSVLCAACLFAFSFVPAYRTAYHERFGRHSGLLEDYIAASQEALSRKTTEQTDLSLTLGNLITRFGGIDNAVHVMEVVPDQVDFQYFHELLLLPFTIIPQAIFPSKPTSDVARLFTVQIAGMIYGGSAAPHPVGEGYLNLGWLGVPILFWIWGVYQALLYRGFYLPRKEIPLVQTLYAFYMLSCIGFGGWIIGSLLGLPGQIITLLPLILILRTTQSKKIWNKI